MPRLDIGRFRLAAGYSFADAEVRASGAALPLDGLRPAQTPRHSLAATISLAKPARRLCLGRRALRLEPI